MRPIVDVRHDDVVQLCLTGPMFDWVQRSLRARGLYLFPIPVGDDDLRTFGIGISGICCSRALWSAVWGCCPWSAGQ